MRGEIMQSYKIIYMSQQSELLPVTQTNEKPKTMLSPFTWNNLAVPILPKITQPKNQGSKDDIRPQKMKSVKLADIKMKSPPKAEGLETIIEKKVKQVKPKKEPIIAKKISGKSQETQQFAQLSRTITHPVKRYSMKDKQEEKVLRKTINASVELKPTTESPIKKPKMDSPGKKIRYLNAKNNMQHYLKMNLTRAGWQQSKQKNKQAQILWSNEDRPTDYNEVHPGQYYNHIKGSHHLTNKGYLHEQLQAMDLKSYPTSYMIPKQYDQFMEANNNIAINKMLKIIASEIVNHFGKENVKEEDLLSYEISLGEILTSTILQAANEETKILIKLCMYMEIQRIEQKYVNYFQVFQNYTKVNLQPKAHLFDPLVEKAAIYLDGDSRQFVDFSYGNLDYRLLVLLLHYNRLFQEKDISYTFSQNLWIVKPIASSRGAGISILKSSSEFCSRGSAGWCQFKNRKKFENKIMQKYISNPYILPGPGQYSGRKFDIRQWVLIVSHQERPSVFRYHTAYCRFASQTFTLNKLHRQIHLTNYTLFKDEAQKTLPSVMMIEELFGCTREDLRGKYVQQSTQIIQDVIENCHNLQFQQGCFQLFGFDFLFDSRGGLHLLEINLNPACASSRYEPLRVETQTMAQTMLSLVTEKIVTDKWVQILGPAYGGNDDDSQIVGTDDIEVRPFYKDYLSEEESLIAMIRHRKWVLEHIEVVVKRYWLRRLVSKESSQVYKIPEREKPIEVQEEIQKPLEQQKSQKSKGSMITPLWPQ